MGGCTLTVIRDTRDEAIEYIKGQIMAAAEGGLWPDSELIVLQEGAKIAELYRVELINAPVEGDNMACEINLTEVKKGRAFHVGVAGRYNRPLKAGEWVATVHVHS